MKCQKQILFWFSAHHFVDSSSIEGSWIFRSVWHHHYHHPPISHSHHDHRSCSPVQKKVRQGRVLTTSLWSMLVITRLVQFPFSQRIHLSRILKNRTFSNRLIAHEVKFSCKERQMFKSFFFISDKRADEIHMTWTANQKQVVVYVFFIFTLCPRTVFKNKCLAQILNC